MSVIDKALAAVTPQSSAEKRAEATAKARAAAERGDGLNLALDHHDQIRSSFEAGWAAKSAADRRTAMEALALVLNGYSLAEKLVLYPAMAPVPLMLFTLETLRTSVPSGATRWSDL